MTPPPQHTMQALTTLISAILTTQSSSEILEALTISKPYLLSHIHASSEAREIRYRSHLSTTKLHPAPTAAENQWLTTHSLPLPKHLAALHLRDYLHETFLTNTHRLLHSTTLMSHATPHQVLQFATRELQEAYSAVSTILTNSTPAFQELSSRRARPNSETQLSINATTALLSPNPPVKPCFTPSPVTVLGLLLMACSMRFPTFEDLLPLINAYVTLIQSPSANLHPLCNHTALYLFTSATTTSI